MAFKTNNITGTTTQTQSAPTFARAPQSQAMTAGGGMQLFEYAVDGEEVKLTVEDIKAYFCPKATDKECVTFGYLCKANGLNPWLRDAYLIKYSDNEPATMVVGKDAYSKRAEACPAYDGTEAGITVYNTNTQTIEHREGAAYYPAFGEQLIGGWAKVYRKDRSRPQYEEVALDEYLGKKKSGEVTAMWQTKPGTMIRKVALVHALREAFPLNVQGMYDEDEMPVRADFEGTAQELAEAQMLNAPKQPKPRRVVKAPEPAPEADPLADIEEAPDGDPA